MQLFTVVTQGLKIATLAFPLVGFQIVSSNFFQYIGKPQKAIVLSMTRQLLFLVPLIILLPPIYGTMGVWMSMPIADTLSTIFTGVLIFIQVRQLKYRPETISVI